MIVHAKALGKSKDNLRTTYGNLKSTIFFVESEGILPTGVMESLDERVRDKVNFGGDSLQVITSAASLAHHGLLCPVKRLWLEDVDLTSVPAEHMVALVSSVTNCVRIGNVSGCDLVTILDSVKSQVLNIYNRSLGSEETQALVQALETRVEEVMVGNMTLDIEALTEYNGQGKCLLVTCLTDVGMKYSEQLKTWAQRINWEIIPSILRRFQMKRP